MGPFCQNFLAKCPCFKTIQQNVPILNLIFRKSSYVKSNLKKEKRKKELEFHVKFLTLLDFHQIEFFIETRFLENRVLK